MQDLWDRQGVSPRGCMGQDELWCQSNCHRRGQAGRGCGILHDDVSRISVRSFKENMLERSILLTEWTKGWVRKPVNVDVEDHTSAVFIRGASDVSTNSSLGAIWEDGLIGYAGWVPFHYGRIAQFTGCAWDRRWSLSSGKSETAESREKD